MCNERSDAHLPVAARMIDDQQSAGGIHELAGARMCDERRAVHRRGANDALEGDLLARRTMRRRLQISDTICDILPHTSINRVDTLARSLACPADDGRRADAGDAAAAPPCSDGTEDDDEGPCTRGLAARADCDAAAETAEAEAAEAVPAAAERAEADADDDAAEMDEADGVPGAARRADCEPDDEEDMPLSFFEFV